MTKKLRIKDIYIGGGSPIAVQSMTTTKTADTSSTIGQIMELERAGCDIVRVAVPDMPSAQAIKSILAGINIPLVADIHFDYRLAVQSIESGAHKIRFNPGNIGSEQNIKYLVDCAKDYGVPIRIGVNSGSVDKAIRAKYSKKAEQLVESALQNVALLEKFSFYDTVISVKSSSVAEMIDAYERLSKLCDYPLHLGVTEAGTRKMGEIKSAIGIGALLVKGIGDTIRVSLTDSPVSEVEAARNILKSLDLIDHVNVVSCPTCGRCGIDLQTLAREVNELTEHITKPLKIAVMGCVVNGPGEAEDADLGIAGGAGRAVIFKKGVPVKTVPQAEALDALKKELNILLDEHTSD